MTYEGEDSLPAEYWHSSAEQQQAYWRDRAQQRVDQEEKQHQRVSARRERTERYKRRLAALIHGKPHSRPFCAHSRVRTSFVTPQDHSTREEAEVTTCLDCNCLFVGVTA